MSLKRIVIGSVFILIIGYLIYSALIISTPVQKISHPKGGQFAGSESCASCHLDIHQTFLNTAHNKTSALASKSTVLGSFKEGENVLQFNDHDRVVMNEYDSGLFQSSFINDEFQGAQRFDIVTGSGTKGQTYLSWRGNKIVQLPVSNSVPEKQWSSSPGNPTDRIILNRPVISRCLNCHSTHIDVTAQMNAPPDYDKHSMILGIQCERCHGPAARHVSFEGEIDPKTKNRNVANPKFLTRRQQLDLCAQCHSANLTSSSPDFFFLPGDNLASKPFVPQVIDTSSNAEVHGNQYDMLEATKCFTLSNDMTCSSCHNTHKNERGNLASFSSKCLTCHSGKTDQLKTCKLTSRVGDDLRKNCIDCHMPVKASNKIMVSVGNSKSLKSEMARTHFISIYPTQTEKILNMLKNLNP